MKKKHFLSFSIPFLPLIFIFYYSCTKDKGHLPITTKSLCDSLNVKYLTDIKPIIIARCAVNGCHKSGGSAPGDFTTYAGVSPNADAPLGNGKLRNRVLIGLPTFSWMPASGPIPVAEREKIDCWLKSGAPNN